MSNDRLPVVRSMLRMSEDSVRENLVRECRRLAEDLTKLAAVVEKDPNFTPSVNGIVKGRGAEVDSLCARLYDRREVIGMLGTVVAGLKDPP